MFTGGLSDSWWSLGVCEGPWAVPGGSLGDSGESLGGAWGILRVRGACLGGVDASMGFAVPATDRFVMYTKGITCFVISLGATPGIDRHPSVTLAADFR